MWIYLCDDDPVDRFRTEYFLKQYAARRSFRVQIQTFLSAAELLQAFQTAAEPPFLILLDILMSSLDGMAAAKQLRLSGYEGSIVFTTSSTEHALESYSVYADGFLAKPFTYDDFVFTMKRVEHLFRQTSESLHVHEAGHGEQEIYLDTILYLEIENRHLRIYTTFDSIGKWKNFGLCFCPGGAFHPHWLQLSGQSSQNSGNPQRRMYSEKWRFHHHSCPLPQ